MDSYVYSKVCSCNCHRPVLTLFAWFVAICLAVHVEWHDHTWCWYIPLIPAIGTVVEIQTLPHVIIMAINDVS